MLCPFMFISFKVCNNKVPKVNHTVCNFRYHNIYNSKLTCWANNHLPKITICSHVKPSSHLWLEREWGVIVPLEMLVVRHSRLNIHFHWFAYCRAEPYPFRCGFLVLWLQLWIHQSIFHIRIHQFFVSIILSDCIHFIIIIFFHTQKAHCVFDI